jgi:hypothetical protein
MAATRGGKGRTGGGRTGGGNGASAGGGKKGGSPIGNVERRGPGTASTPGSGTKRGK